MKTKEEIQKQVNGLEAMKKWLPEFSAFGDPNHRGIDAQLDIIEGKTTLDDYGNEEDFDDEWQYIREQAQTAEIWLDGNSDENLYDER